MVFDAAVSLPLLGGADVGPPVFASLDLDTMESTGLKYGVPMGLDEPALGISQGTLSDYAELAAGLDLWGFASGFCNSIGIDVSPECLQARYGDTRRVVRV